MKTRDFARRSLEKVSLRHLNFSGLFWELFTFGTTYVFYGIFPMLLGIGSIFAFKYLFPQYNKEGQ